MADKQSRLSLPDLRTMEEGTPTLGWRSLTNTSEPGKELLDKPPLRVLERMRAWADKGPRQAPEPTGDCQRRTIDDHFRVDAVAGAEHSSEHVSTRFAQKYTNQASFNWVVTDMGSRGHLHVVQQHSKKVPKL